MTSDIRISDDPTPIEYASPDADTSASDPDISQTDPESADSSRPSAEYRHMRRRYLARVNRAARERDEARKALEEKDRDIERIVDERIHAYETERKSREEQSRFFERHPDMAEHADDLVWLRETFPAMSWDDARTFYIAQKSPERLLDRQTRARRTADTLDTTSYRSQRLTHERDPREMSAREYRQYLDTLLSQGKITL